MNFTKHAIIRGQQRGIPREVTEMIVRYGEPAAKRGGAVEYRIKNRDRGIIIGDLKKVISFFERSGKKAVLVADDTGEVITAYNIRR